MRTVICIFLCVLLLFNAKAQSTDEDITDQFSADFKSALWKEKIISDTLRIMQSEVSGIKELRLERMHTPVKSFRGIACFRELESLILRNYSYRATDSVSLDLSGNTNLRRFVCDYLHVYSLNISSCKALEELVCTRVWLDTLDLSQNLRLKKLLYGKIPEGFEAPERLKCLILPSVPCPLEELLCGNVLIEELGLRNCPRLRTLKCKSEKLSFLDLDACSQLDTLICRAGSLDTLKLENCPVLTYLDCSNNRIRSLDLSRNVYLTTVLANKQESPYLISEGGRAGCLERLVLPDNTRTGEGLRVLECRNNALQELDVSRSAYLQHLDCSWNKLKELKTNHNSQLIRLECGYNFIPFLDLSFNTKLQKIHCGGQGYQWIRESGKDYGSLKELILPRQKKNQKGYRLKELIYNDAQLIEPVDLNQYPELRYLDCSGCGVKKLNLRRHPELRELECRHNPIVFLNLNANRKLSTVNIRHTPLRKLDMKRNTQLIRLKCSAKREDELLLILSKYIDLDRINFDTGTYEKELLKKKGLEWIHLPPEYMIIRQK